MAFNAVSQLDELIEHAQYHNQEYGDNLFVFIAKHYGELKTAHEEEHQHEKEDHEQLPFKNSKCSHIVSINSFLLTPQVEGIKAMVFSTIKKHTFFYQPPSSSLHIQGLLQPPRLS